MKNWMITWLVGNAMKHVATKDLEITYESGSIANCILATFMNRYKTYFFCRYFMYWGNLNAASNGPVEFSTHLSTLECVEIPENLLQFPIQYIPVEIRMGFALKKIAPRFKITEFKSKPAEMNYAFEHTDVPDVAQYLQVLFSPKFPALPTDLKGK